MLSPLLNTLVDVGNRIRPVSFPRQIPPTVRLIFLRIAWENRTTRSIVHQYIADSLV